VSQVIVFERFGLYRSHFRQTFIIQAVLMPFVLKQQRYSSASATAAVTHASGSRTFLRTSHVLPILQQVVVFVRVSFLGKW